MNTKHEDLTGKIFGKLTALYLDEKKTVRGKQNKTYWMCRCDCGNEKSVFAYNLKRGSTISCGCERNKINKARLTHGHGKKNKNTPTYRAWYNMKTKCYNQNSDRWKYVGGRGIIVCDRWLNSFENFLEDMGECPEKHHLARRDDDENYTPENCFWEEEAKRASRLVNTKQYLKLLHSKGLLVFDVQTTLKILSED